MEKIAVFGGTFDPVQTEHVNLVKNAIKQLNLNKLIVMPDNIPPHKQGKEITPTGDRLQMCRLAFSGIDGVEVSDYEINKGGNSYSYITMEHFREEYPNAKLYFIVGTDMLKSFPQWKNPERILACCDLIYCEREGEKDSEKAHQTFIEKYGENKIVKLDYIGKNLSATKVRVYTKLGLNIDGLVSSEVKDYIYANNLYQGDKYYNYVKNELPEKRLLHTAGVILTATKFAERLNVDVEKAELSALLHDVAKYKSVADYKDCLLPENTPKSCEHQYLGAYIVEKELGIKDDEIINAVRYHTTGRKGMTLIEKIIYLADLIEPSRTFDGVDEIRKKTDENFEEGFKFALKEILKFIKKGNGELDLKTVEAVEYYCGKGEKMTAEKLTEIITCELDKHKAEDVVKIDVKEKSSLADYFIIASGRSTTQVKALAEYVEEAVESNGAEIRRKEGLADGRWAVIDCGDVIVHIFNDETRLFYHLERLWSEN